MYFWLLLPKAVNRDCFWLSYGCHAAAGTRCGIDHSTLCMLHWMASGIVCFAVWMTDPTELCPGTFTSVASDPPAHSVTTPQHKLHMQFRHHETPSPQHVCTPKIQNISLFQAITKPQLHWPRALRGQAGRGVGYHLHQRGQGYAPRQATKQLLRVTQAPAVTLPV